MVEIDKVARYEAFLNETLLNDLRSVLKLRDKVFEEQAEFVALRNSIDAIKRADLVDREPLKTKVDLGCNFYCQANVPDPSKIFVAVGLGFFVELTLDEALNFIDRKEKSLTAEAEKLTKDCVKLKAQRKLVLGGLRELQNIPNEEPKKPQRDIFS